MKYEGFAKLHQDVTKGEAGGQILWQPRIECWYGDKKFYKQPMPKPYDGMSLPEIYRHLGCSARVYEYRHCIEAIQDPAVKEYRNIISETITEHVIETPVGKLTMVGQKTDNSPYAIKKKWWITTEEDFKVASWIEERKNYKFSMDKFNEIYAKWGNLGAPTTFMPRVNVQHLYIDMMGVEEATYALYDYPETIEEYFRVLEESHERFIAVINDSPIDIINFGDNIHVGTLSPALFKKYVLPTYLRRNELLHKAGKFTHAHWDGDTKGLLPFAKECGLDGIEAITPMPQGDVTVREIKDALGDEVFLIDGIAATLFDTIFSEEELVAQVNELLELFAPKIILGISDEISSTGDIERVKLVGEIVDSYNKSL